ncbi:MAG: STAS domain-containing protein [Terracidiphilus sp.]
MAPDTPLTIDRLPGIGPGTVILRLTGPLTLATVLPLRAQFRDFEPPRLTILDFTGVSFLDSAGMSELINHEVYCRGRRVQLVIAGVNPRVLSVLQITRLDKVLSLAATVQEAEASAKFPGV